MGENEYDYSKDLNPVLLDHTKYCWWLLGKRLEGKTEGLKPENLKNFIFEVLEKIRDELFESQKIFFESFKAIDEEFSRQIGKIEKFPSIEDLVSGLISGQPTELDYILYSAFQKKRELMDKYFLEMQEIVERVLLKHNLGPQDDSDDSDDEKYDEDEEGGGLK